MKKSRRIWWLLAGTLIFVSIILWAGEGMYGEGGGKGQVVVYFCLSGGLLIGFLLIIEWLVEFQKTFSLFETNKEKAEKRKGLCEAGRQLLRRKDKAESNGARRYWQLNWQIHQRKCPTCQGVKLD